MNTYTYHREIRIVIASLLAAFDGIILKRQDGPEEGNTVDEIRVPVMFAPKQRVLQQIVNTSNHIKCPALAIWLQSVDRDKGRVFNKTDGYWQAERVDRQGRQIPQPIPVTMSFSMSFFGRFLKDCDQFITCLFSNFNPYIVISYKHPDVDEEVRCTIEWSGKAVTNYPVEDLDGGKAFRVFVDSTFTVSTYIFRNTPDAAGRIYNIPIDFTALSQLGDSYDWMHAQETEDNTDIRILSGRPFVQDSLKNELFAGIEDQSVKVEGNMFEDVSTVAIVNWPNASAVDIFPSGVYQTFDFYSGDKTLSGRFPPFRGVSAEYSILTDHRLLVQVPTPETVGNIDVWLCSDFGIGKLSEDSYRAYLTDQKPTTSGIKITTSGE